MYLKKSPLGACNSHLSLIITQQILKGIVVQHQLWTLSCHAPARLRQNAYKHHNCFLSPYFYKTWHHSLHSDVLLLRRDNNYNNENTLALWVWTKHVDEGPYWCYYTHMKWDPSVSWGGVLGDCGRGGEEGDRLFTAMKQSKMLSTNKAHTQIKSAANY